jgi:hypothetical protein
MEEGPDSELAPRDLLTSDHQE